MGVVSAERFAAVIVDVADTLTDEFDIIDFLHTVTSSTADLLDAAAVGLMLADPAGELHFVAASEEAAETLELFQLQNREGPGHDAFTSGLPVSSADIAGEVGRWPRFAPRAIEAGLATAQAVPLRLRDEVIGALTVFAAGERALDATELAVVRALADVATIGLLQERAIRESVALADQLQRALTSRVIIEQAKGALAQLHATTVDDAFERLRTHARSNRLSLTDVATGVVNDPNRFPELTRIRP